MAYFCWTPSVRLSKQDQLAVLSLYVLFKGVSDISNNSLQMLWRGGVTVRDEGAKRGTVNRTHNNCAHIEIPAWKRTWK